MWFNIFAGLLFLIVFYVRWTGSYWKRRNIVGPSPTLLFGNMLNYIFKRQHYGEVYDDIYRSHPNLAYVGVYKVLNKPAILVRDVEIIKDIMTTNFNSFYNNDFNVDRELDPLISQNPFAANDEHWKIARTNLAPLFTPMKIKMMFPIISDICDKFIDYIKNNNRENVDAVKLCSKFTLSVMASCGMGIDAETLVRDDSPFETMTENIYSHGSLLKTTAVLFLPILSRILKMPYIPQEVDNWMRGMVKNIMKMRANHPEEKRYDLLQNLLDTREKRGDITDNMITGYCLTMILEGFETSSSLMSYSLFELASNPDIQRTAQVEIDTILENFNGQITDEAVQQMQYLDGLCYETLRLYPAMLVLTKICTKRYELPTQTPSKSLSKMAIEPGTIMVLPAYSLHRDPTFFENPNEFDPTRFIGENRNQHHKFSYLSFGEGQRICPGMKLAMSQSKAGLAAILSQFNVTLAEKQTLPLEIGKTAFLMCCSNGIWLNFSDRKK